MSDSNYPSEEEMEKEIQRIGKCEQLAEAKLRLVQTEQRIEEAKLATIKARERIRDENDGDDSPLPPDSASFSGQ